MTDPSDTVKILVALTAAVSRCGGLGNYCNCRRSHCPSSDNLRPVRL
jgi:hypothetical protein